MTIGTLILLIAGLTWSIFAILNLYKSYKNSTDIAIYSGIWLFTTFIGSLIGAAELLIYIVTKVNWDWLKIKIF